jgi:hypothetical protein
MFIASEFGSTDILLLLCQKPYAISVSALWLDYDHVTPHIIDLPHLALTSEATVLSICTLLSKRCSGRLAQMILSTCSAERSLLHYFQLKMP